ncbi:MAG: phosphoglucosamine mutase [Alphaproteobacteria bacterium]|nr:phosphoglucosamine mutase [Alphaproteobacteria bacterium]
MTRRYFGTDGIRGTANSGAMTAETALKVGLAAGKRFLRGGHRHRVVIGKDTRLSGYMFEPALTAGFVAMGMDAVLVGPMPTPAVAMLTRSLRADLGVMISASHNPFQDNGIKLFGPDGYKLSDEAELEIEALMERDLRAELARPDRLGRAQRLDDAEGRYIEFVKATIPGDRVLDGLKIVVDCANGAAYKVAPKVLYELGAEVVPVGVAPDGFNINRGCGSTHPEFLSEQVAIHGAQIGIALDGDADRLIVVDEKGAVLDGDQLMAVIAASWRRQGKLRSGAIVTTVMSNMGLERHLAGLGLALHRSAVGDRYVVEKMRESGCNLGGEQSGHIILTDHSTTGDGLIAALQILAVLAAEGRPASQLLRVFTPFPQKLHNVRYTGESPLAKAPVKAAIADAEKRLAGRGRLLIRKSGTEPLIRVMAEAEDPGLVEAVVREIAAVVEKAA